MQIIDPETRELRSYIQQILADGKIVLKEQIKPEMHQSIVELDTEFAVMRVLPRQTSIHFALSWQDWRRATRSRSLLPARIRFRIGWIN